MYFVTSNCAVNHNLMLWSKICLFVMKLFSTTPAADIACFLSFFVCFFLLLIHSDKQFGVGSCFRNIFMFFTTLLSINAAIVALKFDCTCSKGKNPVSLYGKVGGKFETSFIHFYVSQFPLQLGQHYCALQHQILNQKTEE